MILKSVELRHVRQIKAVKLDLSNPLTVIGGPQGVGKTTVQKAILASLFVLGKKERDALQSRFDLDSSPGATLVCKKQAGGAEIVLKRDLLDDSGEWREEGVVTKAKGKALAKVQELLPISPDAAALLLWGLQEEMAAVLEAFPADGHSLLAHAAIRGGGPDPKQVIADLEKESKAARNRGAVNPGVLTRCEQRVEGLKSERDQARAALAEVKDLQRRYEHARAALALSAKQRAKAEKEIGELEELERLLSAAILAAKKAGELEARLQEWEGLDAEIAKAEKSLADLRGELAVLDTLYRVARDRELVAQISELKNQFNAAADAEKKCAELDRRLNAKLRPSKADDERKRACVTRMNTSRAAIEATGVRYQLAVESESRAVQVSEDNGPLTQKQVAPAQPVQGVAGRVVVVANGLRIEAGGKQDISALKAEHNRTQAELKHLFRQFEVENEEELDRLREERLALEMARERALHQLEKELKGATPATLRSRLDALRKAQQENGATQADTEAVAHRVLGSASEIKGEWKQKDGEIKEAQRQLRAKQGKRPTEEAQRALRDELLNARKQAGKLAAAFAAADKREPTEVLLQSIQRALKGAREQLPGLATAEREADVKVARLAEDLKHAGPPRPVAAIEAELLEAETALRHEQLFQDARDLLARTIEEKIRELTANIPRELGQRVGKHLQRLTRGALEGLSMTEELQVSAVAEKGLTLQWKPAELSCGERHQAALALKIAVACAIAESSGPVFVILDDSLVSFDPQRRAAAEKLLLDLVADGKLQVILLTCHTDWAEDWRRRTPERIHYIELGRVAEYYRPPPSLSAE